MPRWEHMDRKAGEMVDEGWGEMVDEEWGEIVDEGEWGVTWRTTEPSLNWRFEWFI